MLALPASLTREAATLALCWRIVRRDGLVMGFTQHDSDLVFGGVVHHASSGLDVAAARHLEGLAANDAVLLGALVSDGLMQQDILSGLYDGATVETWMVDWSDPIQNVLLDCGMIGKIETSDHGFKAEILSIADRLMQPQGRLFEAHCSALLGDTRCKIALADPAFTYRAVVTETDGHHSVTVDAGSYADDWFSRGLLRVEDGTNAGMVMDIKRHDRVSSQARLILWQSLPQLLKTGDHVVLVAGCDKTAAMCQSRFANIVNFRGFPRMPGNDLLIRRVTDGEAGMDGGSLFQ